MRGIMKILAIAGIVALLPGGAVVPVAATSEVTISIGAPAESAPDSDFTANVNISEVVDFDACNYDVSFDASVLELDDVTPGLIGSSTIPVNMYNEINPGTCRVVQNVPDFPGVSGSGYLAVLHFHVIGSGGHSSPISPSNGMLSDKTASEILTTWAGHTVTVRVAAAAPENAAPPPVVNSPPAATPNTPVPSEDTTPPTAVNSAPEAAAPNEVETPLPARPINWPVLWGVIEGVIVVGLIIFLLARKRAY